MQLNPQRAHTSLESHCVTVKPKFNPQLQNNLLSTGHFLQLLLVLDLFCLDPKNACFAQGC